MEFTISCEAYARLSAIPLLLDGSDTRKYLKSIYLERKDGNLIAVTTNVKIAAVEHLGGYPGPDECTAITIDPVLIAACEKEIAYNSTLQIIVNPALKYTTIKSMFGYNYPGNAYVDLPEANNFNAWRKWFPDEMPIKPAGAMYWNTHLIHALATSSPSGCLVFPDVINTNFPIVIRDDNDPDWVGLFIGKPNEAITTVAKIPDWIA